jgi:hypothetical protein
MLTMPILAGQLILHLKEYKLDGKGKQQNKDHDVISTHSQPPAMTAAEDTCTFSSYS